MISLIALVALAAMDPPAPPAAESPIHFRDATPGSGLESAITTSGKMPSTQVLEVKGGGLLAIDFDNDGDFDLFLPNGATLEDPEHGPGARLFENLGNGTFRDITASSGIDLHRWSFGGAVGDFDGDGLDDIYVCSFGQDVLLKNMGGGRFKDVTAEAGIKDNFWSTQAAFADLDGDGDLDLYVTNYLAFDPAHPLPPTHFKGTEVMAGPKGYDPQPDMLYENLGDGKFADRSESSGIRAVKPAFGLGVAILDFDGDGKPDIFVGNDSMPNFLFRNKGGMHFVEDGMRSGIATNIQGAAQATMGIAIGDVDGNGRPDVFTTVFSSDTNTLHLNIDGTFFDDRTSQFGVGAPSRPYLGWACDFVDLDHDGREDLIIFNGHVYPQASKALMDSEYQQPPMVMHREGARFAVVDAGPDMRIPHRDRAAVFADFDGDGDVDVVVGGVNQPLRLLLNEHNGKDDWLLVSLKDARPGSKNHRGLGAKIELKDAHGATQTRWLWSGGPFMSNTVPQAHFGVPAGHGDLTLTVTWPDGSVQTQPVPRTGSKIVVNHP